MKTKYIFVTGGVLSSLGKGITAASVANLMESRGYDVTLIKMDPYINVDPGTMSPYQHGEVFVTGDAAETDLDLGHYERFTTATMTRDNSFTAGKVYEDVIKKERRGDYLGATVQVIPHITDEIKFKIRKAANDHQIAIVEVGGTVGDIESLPFLEAIRQMGYDEGHENVAYVHVTLVPYIRTAHELKSKPTQHSVKELLSLGISPDFLICRAEKAIEQDMMEKIARFCNVRVDHVISAPDVNNIYQIPITYFEQDFDSKIASRLKMTLGRHNVQAWKDMLIKMDNPVRTVNIAVAGKYTELTESYKSLNEAIKHGGIPSQTGVKIHFVDSEKLQSNNDLNIFEKMDGIIVPGGFGERGIGGKLLTIGYARQNNIPFLGICLGMQLAVVEYFMNVLKINDAYHAEFEAPAGGGKRVIGLMEKQKNIVNLGGTMRLGGYKCDIRKNTKAAQIYKKAQINERHRHRYEVENEVVAELEKGGMTVSGRNPESNLVEIIEIETHPFFIGCQFHPEYQSRPMAPNPLFKAFVEASFEFQSHKLGKKPSTGVEGKASAFKSSEGQTSH